MSARIEMILPEEYIIKAIGEYLARAHPEFHGDAEIRLEISPGSQDGAHFTPATARAVCVLRPKPGAKSVIDLGSHPSGRI